MVALNVLRGLASLVPGMTGAAYVGSQKPEGIEDMFKAVTGTTGISRASEDLTKEINVKKVADRLKAAGVDPETANKIAQGAVGQIGEAVIGDDEASTIAQDIGKGLEGGKPSGSAMITVSDPFDIKKEAEKLRDFDPVLFDEVEGAMKDKGFTESEGIAQLPPFTEQEEQKVNVGDVGFTEAEAMPTILTAGIAPEDIDPKNITDTSYQGIQVRVKGPILEEFEDPGKGVYLVKNPDGSLTDLKGKVFENASLRVDPKAFDVRTFNANNEIVGDYNLRDDIVTDDKGRRKYVGEGDLYKVNRLTGKNFDLIDAPEGTDIEKTSAKNGLLAITKGLSTGGQHYYTMGVDFQNPTQLMEYPENPNNPRLLPTSTGNVILGNKVGEIKIKSSGKTHPIYDNVIIGNESTQDTTEIVGTDSGVVVNFADRKARDLEMGDSIENYINYSTYNAESDRTQSEIFGDPKPIKGHGDDPRFSIGFSKKDGSRGYAYGYLTDKGIAFVDQLTAVDGSFSPQEYKEIKDAIQEYTGATKVGGFRISGARRGKDEQATIMKAAGGIVDRPLYD
jgi:hypothetical protein